MASSPLPRRINVISYNLWLIPFSGAWNFGRVNRCRDRVAFECAKLEREAPSDLQIVALQEAWAFRAGLAYPLLWLMHKFEAFLLGLVPAAVRTGGRTRRDALEVDVAAGPAAQVAIQIIRREAQRLGLELEALAELRARERVRARNSPFADSRAGRAPGRTRP